jgi:predicted nucleotidyltransferase
MINLNIQNTIQQKLVSIEEEHDVKIIYVLESGSRAWGFESQDSDYDVRFIYAHKKDWYLNILPKRDVIEYPIIDEYDYSGWDLRKALFLMNKSNPVLFEWLNSPIVYYKDDYAYDKLFELSKAYFSPVSSIYHYLHMARGNFREFLQTDMVKAKKYFYVLRPILAAMWIEKHNEAPPLEFTKLLTQITDDNLLNPINALLERKRKGVEFDAEPRNDKINAFIETQIQHFENGLQSFNPTEKPSQEQMEKVFVEILNHTDTLATNDYTRWHQNCVDNVSIEEYIAEAAKFEKNKMNITLRNKTPQYKDKIK